MLTGIIDALIDGTIKVRDKHHVTGGAITSFSFDVSDRIAKRYSLLSFIKNGNGSRTTAITINGDNSNNYGSQYISGANTSATATRVTNVNGFYIGGSAVTGEYELLKTDIINTGNNVISDSLSALQISTSGTNNTLRHYGSVYDSVVNINNIDVISSTTGGFADGSFFVLLEHVETDGMQTGTLEPNKIEGGIELVDEYEVSGGAVSSFSFTGLNGDTDKIWLLKGLFKSAVTTNAFFIRFNNDSGSNYPTQRLYGVSTSYTANRATETYISSEANNGTGDLEYVNAIIFALSGNVRLCLLESVGDISSSAVGFVGIVGSAWNNTINEITSLLIGSTQSSGIDDGSKVELYKINDI